MKTRVLIIDDEVDFTQLLQLNLEVTGRYEVAVVNTANLAVCTAHAFNPDIILLDVMMPELNGGDVLARLESQETLRHTPVIFVTALAGSDGSLGGGTGRPSDPPTLSKPINLDHLERMMTERLEAAMV